MIWPSASQLNEFVSRKFLVLLFVAASVAQDITLTCNFGIFFDEYFCTLGGIEVLDPEANIIITGNHMENMTNDDVEVVRIVASNTPFVINAIFDVFPNLLELNIDNRYSLRVVSIKRNDSIYMGLQPFAFSENTRNRRPGMADPRQQQHHQT